MRSNTDPEENPASDQSTLLLHDYIVDRLARHADENDLILAVCERGKIDWTAACTLVEKIRVEHESTISLRQLPLKSLIAVATLVVGMSLVIVSVSSLIDLYQNITGIISTNLAEAGDRPMLENGIQSLSQFFMQDSNNAVPFNMALLINGLGMIFGSLLGMRETWAWMIEWISSRLWK
jgi:hypothetical protein